MSRIDSGVEWLGEIPDSWKIVPNKVIMHKEKNICDKYNNENILSLTTNGVIVKDIKNPSGKMPATFDGYQIVKKGNLLMCLFDIDVTPRCIGLIKNDGLTSPAYSNFVLYKGYYNKYYYYYYLMMDNTKELLHLSKNLRHSLTEEQLGYIPTLVPPYDTQVHISEFLDNSILMIDALITNQEEQIKKLKDYKQSFITEILTKGINKQKMKYSGIEWIGDIPESSEIIRLRFLIKDYKAGPFGSALITEKLNTDGRILVYSPEHVTSQNFNSPKNLFLPEERREEMSQFFVKKDDIIFPIVGSLGKALLIKQDMPEGIINQRLAKFSVDNKIIDIDYFLYLFHKSDFFKEYYNLNSRGSFIFNLTKSIINDMPLIIPDKHTQKLIVELLDNKCEQIDKLIKIKQEKIVKLQEYKKSLIYEYVTGKKEV